MQRTFDGPTNVTIEASWDTISEHNLDTFEGEQFDRINAVIAIDSDASNVTFTTCRTIEAWRRGERNAGRGEFIIPRKNIAAAHLPGGEKITF